MKTKYLLGIAVFILLLVPNVSAITGSDCQGDNLVTNITINQSGSVSEDIIILPCPNGCTEIAGGKYTCVTSSFFIPIELYILFEVIAFVLFFFMLIDYHDDKDGFIVVLPVLSMVMFLIVSLMSFNMEGLAFMMGGALNMGLGLLSLAHLIIGSINTIS